VTVESDRATSPRWRTTLKEIVLEYEHLGHRALQNGTRLIGHVPHVGSEAYLFELYAPLVPDDITALERELGQPLPKPLREFYAFHNGLNVFSDALSIDGRRTSYVRKGDAAVQPYSITIPNVEERPRRAQAGDVIFGGYSFDGSQLFFRRDDETVHVARRGTAVPYGSWPSFDDMLDSELRRLRGHYDEAGKKRDPDADTTPRFA